MTTTVLSPRSRRTGFGAVGGALWALSPVAWLIGDIRDADRGSASFAALLLCFALAHVVGPALVAVAATGLGAALGGGRVLAAGAVLTAVGLAAVALGNSTELVSLATTGETSVLGYVVFYLGFLTAFVGALLVGAVVIRRRRDPAARTGGWLLALAVPLGIGIGALLALLVPASEAAFSAAVAVPTGIGWALLGRALPRPTAPSSERLPDAQVR